MLLFYSHQLEYIHKNVYYMLFSKNSMFHENHVNDIECFHYVTKNKDISIPKVC